MRLVPRLLIPLAMGLLALSAGCASHSGSGSSGYPEESWYAQRQRAAQEARFRRSYEAVFDESAEEGGPRQAKAVQVARSAIGTPYVPGGRNPGGFDCSGLVQWAYKSVGINLPRTAREQSAVGKRITRVEDMRAGDIVAFHHPRRGYHTGIYVGDGKFVHSPRRWTRVRINSPADAVPHILNLSVEGVRGGRFQRMLDECGVCVSVQSACAAQGQPSRAVLAVSGDRRNALSSWRISLSHLTTDAELTAFLAAFDRCYRAACGGP